MRSYLRLSEYNFELPASSRTYTSIALSSSSPLSSTITSFHTTTSNKTKQTSTTLSLYPNTPQPQHKRIRYTTLSKNQPATSSFLTRNITNVYPILSPLTHSPPNNHQHPPPPNNHQHHPTIKPPPITHPLPKQKHIYPFILSNPQNNAIYPSHCESTQDTDSVCKGKEKYSKVK